MKGTKTVALILTVIGTLLITIGESPCKYLSLEVRTCREKYKSWLDIQVSFVS